MGDYHVIAAVSRTLKRLLTNRMQSMQSTPAPEVTLDPPDRAIDSSGDRGSINLFLFHVTENAQLKNQSFPVPGPGADTGPPPLSLDLHYLMTAYRKTNQEGAQRLLGDAMQVFHTYSEITEQLQMQSESAGGGNGGPPHNNGGSGSGSSNGLSSVLASELHGEYENIKITIEPLAVEEISGIWTAFTVPYRLSVAYRVTVVQIESKQPRRQVRLVGPRPQAGPVAHVVPVNTPRIEGVRVRRRELEEVQGTDRWVEKGEVAYPYARIGDVLVIRGYNFAGQKTRVFVGGEDVTGRADRSDERIEVQIPDEPSLQPGSIGVRVVRDVIERADEEASTTIRSNEAFFMLVPRVTSVTPDLQANPATLEVTGTRLYRRDEEDMTFIGDKVVPAADYSSAAETRLEMEIPEGLSAGAYPVRVRVGRVESVDDELLKID